MRLRFLLRAGAAPALALGLATISYGCAAAVGAAMSAQEIRRGIAGVQQLVASSRFLKGEEVEVAKDLTSPLAGTYRAEQILGTDTIRYYVRTVDRPTAPIMSDSGTVTGYVLAGLAATTLDTLEVRVGARAAGVGNESGGRALFFVEGTQPPDPNARTLYPAAFLGRVASGELEEADRQAEELRSLAIEMEAPSLKDLEGQAIPHELFDSVAEGIFTLNPDGKAVYEQEYATEDGRTLRLRFERISRTTLPGAG